jgi:uncharacterized membrane protein
MSAASHDAGSTLWNYPQSGWYPCSREESTMNQHSDGQRQRLAEENIRAVARLQEQAAKRRSVAERFGDAVSALAARESAVVMHVAWFAAWILINTGRLSPIEPFDPFPFTLLTTIVSLEAIFLTLFVLASQSRLTQEGDRRAHLDLQVNLLSEQEMTLVLRMLGELCEHFDLRTTVTSPKYKELASRTDVSQLADQLDQRLPPGGTNTPPTQDKAT